MFLDLYLLIKVKIDLTIHVKLLTYYLLSSSNALSLKH